MRMESSGCGSSALSGSSNAAGTDIGETGAVISFFKMLFQIFLNVIFK